nr:hypothetical protein [uncultured Oscillibacter sp.]
MKKSKLSSRCRCSKFLMKASNVSEQKRFGLFWLRMASMWGKRESGASCRNLGWSASEKMQKPSFSKSGCPHDNAKDVFIETF